YERPYAPGPSKPVEVAESRPEYERPYAPAEEGAGERKTGKKHKVPSPQSLPELPGHIAKIGSADRGGGQQRFYFIDFLTRLFGVKENIPTCIYLLMNVLFIGFVSIGFTNGNVVMGMLLGLVLYILSMAVALSSVGENLLRARVGCKPVKDPEIAARIDPIFQEVYARAREKNQNLPEDIRLFISEDDSPNAFATGRRTVCMTTGMLTRTDDQIRGALGHEFGHLAHKDTDRILVISIGNIFVTAFCFLAQIGAFIMEFIMHIIAIFMGEDGFFFMILASISRFWTVTVVGWFLNVWMWIGNMLCMKTSRGNEYQADEFCTRLGYGTGLISVLYSLGEAPRPKGLFATLSSSHPATEDRVARIRYIMEHQELSRY
ncbi:MAG: M48 family metalloprotease, partial [Eubacteriales bacterium]|nr:M48 family metalloprotease [Eubacteriales bacterium]